MNFEFDDELEMQESAWAIIREWLPSIDDPVSEHINLELLFTKPVHRKLACSFLQFQRATGRCRFLTTDQIVSIASRIESAESDIDKGPGVYIFVSLIHDEVLKVGESGDMQWRISREHLRNPKPGDRSVLINYAIERWSGHESLWHEWLREKEVVALLFPMPNCEKLDRLLIEQCLQAVLKVEMP